jgi:hypothetical protein
MRVSIVTLNALLLAGSVFAGDDSSRDRLMKQVAAERRKRGDQIHLGPGELGRFHICDQLQRPASTRRLAFTNIVAIQVAGSLVMWLGGYRGSQQTEQFSALKRNLLSVAGWSQPRPNVAMPAEKKISSQ